MIQETSFFGSKKDLDVMSRLLSGILCKQHTYLFMKKLIKTKYLKLCLDRLNIRSTKYLFWFRNSWSLGYSYNKCALIPFYNSNFDGCCLRNEVKKSSINIYHCLWHFHTGLSHNTGLPRPARRVSKPYIVQCAVRSLTSPAISNLTLASKISHRSFYIASAICYILFIC